MICRCTRYPGTLASRQMRSKRDVMFCARIPLHRSHHDRRQPARCTCAAHSKPFCLEALHMKALLGWNNTTPAQSVPDWHLVLAWVTAEVNILPKTVRHSHAFQVIPLREIQRQSENRRKAGSFDGSGSVISASSSTVACIQPRLSWKVSTAIPLGNLRQTFCAGTFFSMRSCAFKCHGLRKPWAPRPSLRYSQQQRPEKSTSSTHS